MARAHSRHARRVSKRLCAYTSGGIDIVLFEGWRVGVDKGTLFDSHGASISEFDYEGKLHFVMCLCASDNLHTVP